MDIKTDSYDLIMKYDKIPKLDNINKDISLSDSFNYIQSLNDELIAKISSLFDSTFKELCNLENHSINILAEEKDEILTIEINLNLIESKNIQIQNVVSKLNKKIINFDWIINRIQEGEQDNIRIEEIYLIINTYLNSCLERVNKIRESKKDYYYEIKYDLFQLENITSRLNFYLPSYQQTLIDIIHEFCSHFVSLGVMENMFEKSIDDLQNTLRLLSNLNWLKKLYPQYSYKFDNIGANINELFDNIKQNIMNLLSHIDINNNFEESLSIMRRLRKLKFNHIELVTNHILEIEKIFFLTIKDNLEQFKNKLFFDLDFQNTFLLFLDKYQTEFLKYIHPFSKLILNFIKNVKSIIKIYYEELRTYTIKEIKKYTSNYDLIKYSDENIIEKNICNLKSVLELLNDIKKLPVISKSYLSYNRIENELYFVLNKFYFQVKSDIFQAFEV